LTLGHLHDQMAPYRVAQVRDEALLLLDKLHRAREKKLGIEINDLQHRCRHNPNNSELKYMWGLEAKVEAQFAFMRRLMRTERFVMNTMADFDKLDESGDGELEPEELQEFIKKRDGYQTKFTLIESRTQKMTEEIDVDGDGSVSRTEWLLYMTYLHWMSFTEETVVEKVVQVTKEWKNDKSGSPVMIESIVQLPGRTLNKPGQTNHSNLPLLDQVRQQLNQTQQQSGGLGYGKAPPVAESLRQNADGSYVTTFEHNNPTYGTGKKGWCF